MRIKLIMRDLVCKRLRIRKLFFIIYSKLHIVNNKFTYGYCIIYIYAWNRAKFFIESSYYGSYGNEEAYEDGNVCTYIIEVRVCERPDAG